MSIVKSFSVGEGDTFYIKHDTDNFTIIDCYIDEINKDNILTEFDEQWKEKTIIRFISTHPDEDHIKGLKLLDEHKKIVNFYCVKNNAIKLNEETEDFIHYCTLRSNAYYIHKDCKRKWMNEKDSERGSSGINILWPDLKNENFKEELKKVEKGESPNNISPIIRYSLQDGVKILWFGDLETDFIERIENQLEISEIDILFAPHHGRTSGTIPKSILDILKPNLIVIGEADSEHLDYYSGYNTITQNSAEDIILDCEGNYVHIYVSNDKYSVDFLEKKNQKKFKNYVGSLKTKG